MTIMERVLDVEHPRVRLLTVSEDRTCHCGQALDTCRSEHCPRCGTCLER